MINKEIFSIGDAAKKCGLTVKKIRNWEDREYIPAPKRVAFGERQYRFFSNEDIELISKIKKFMDDGCTLSAAARKAAETSKIGGGKNE